MHMFDTLRETHPYRLLLLAVMAVVVAAQLVAMVMVTQSQVHKAQTHYAQERAAPPVDAQADKVGMRKPGGSGNTAPGGVMNVGYVVSR